MLCAVWQTDHTGVAEQFEWSGVDRIRL